MSNGIENFISTKPYHRLWGKGEFKILSNVVSSQVKLHAKYGGVYPFLAKREHQKNLPLVFEKAVKKASSSISKSEFLISKQTLNPKFKILNSLRNTDLIAVTSGPGLEPCLWTGINFAKELTKKLKMPLFPINHVEAHIFANFINPKYLIQNTKYLFPAVCLVVSGGHTQLILMKGVGRYKILGETRDDAAGECFDKTARILGLGYPGGPAIAAAAAKRQATSNKRQAKLPRPMIHQKNYDFSFSGLKTAVLYDFKNRPAKIRKSKKYVSEMCREIQQAILDVLIHKTLKAAKEYKAKSIILGGGVTANQELRKQFKQRIRKELPNAKYLIPDVKYCTDNAVMIALTAYFRLSGKNKKVRNIEANSDLRL